MAGSNGKNTAVVPRTITSRVYEAMREDIISGVLAPGRKLKIEELIRQYEGGNSPVREALSLLVSDALVERLDQRGFRVVEVSSGEFHELMQTRIWLEERALSEAMRHGDSAWEENIIVTTYRLNNTNRSDSEDAFIANQEWEALHKRFHMVLLAACRSSILLRFCNQLYDQNIRYRHLAGTLAYPLRNIAQEHSALSEAVLKRQEKKALELLRTHYQQTGELLLKVL